MSQPIYEITITQTQGQNNNNSTYDLNAIPIGKDKIKILQNKTGFKEPSDLLLNLHGTAYAVSVLHGLFVYFLNPIKITTKTKSVNGVVTERIVTPIHMFSQKYQLLSVAAATVMTISFLAHAYFYDSRPPFAPLKAINELCKKVLKDKNAYAIFKSDTKYYLFEKDKISNPTSEKLASFLNTRYLLSSPTSLETLLNS